MGKGVLSQLILEKSESREGKSDGWSQIGSYTIPGCIIGLGSLLLSQSLCSVALMSKQLVSHLSCKTSVKM